jgi:phage-related tail protein
MGEFKMAISGTPGANFTGAVWGSDEIKKLLKKEEKKKNSKILDAIRGYHLAHQKAKEAIKSAIKDEVGIAPSQDMVDNAVNALSLTRIFEGKGEEEELVPGLKKELQKYEVDSKEAHLAVASILSEGSEKKVPSDEKVVQYDLDVISMKTLDNPNLLF